MAVDVCLFFNPVSGRFSHNKIENYIRDFAQAGIKVLPISNPDELKKLKNTHIIVAGGDGTLHCAINHADIYSNSFSILPVGSGNDFASAFPKPHLPTLAENIKANRFQPIDLLQVNDTLVHNAAGAGFEALVAKKATEKKVPAALKYILPLAGNLFLYKPGKMNISSAEYNYSGEVFTISLGNGKRAGGGFKLYPNASFSDGKLDLLLIKPPPFWQKLLYVWLVNFGKHLQLKAVEYIQVREVKIELNSKVSWQADGEIYSSEVLHAKVIPGGLKLICG